MDGERQMESKMWMEGKERDQTKWGSRMNGLLFDLCYGVDTF